MLKIRQSRPVMKAPKRKASASEFDKKLKVFRAKYAGVFPSVDEFLRIKHQEVKAGRL